MHSTSMAVQLSEPSPVVIAFDIHLASGKLLTCGWAKVTGMTGCGANERVKALVIIP